MTTSEELLTGGLADHEDQTQCAGNEQFPPGHLVHALVVRPRMTVLV